MNARPVQIVDYQARWPGEFLAIADALRSALGPLAVRIDHIGSTSVPGLASKGIIDGQLTVASFDGFDIVRQLLVDEGWKPRHGLHHDHLPPGDGHDRDEYEKRYIREPEGHKRTHVHVRACGRANQRYALLFRDYLRKHPESGLAYAATKRMMAHYHNRQTDDSLFYEIKGPVCDMVMAPAEEWATRVGWCVGPSDA